MVRFLTVTFLAASLGGADVQTLLATRCQVCHSGKTRTGGLSLATIEDVLKGGKRGPAIVPGKPTESLLYKLISGAQPAMPFQWQPLTPAEVASIRQWIEQGAPWVQPAKWWSLTALRQPAVPNLDDDWIRTPVDAFVLSKLREKGLQPSPEADQRTLIRRLTCDYVIASFNEDKPDKPAYCYDLHATMLYLLGIDHKRLTYRHNGIDRRITDVFGEVIRDLLA